MSCDIFEKSGGVDEKASFTEKRGCLEDHFTALRPLPRSDEVATQGLPLTKIGVVNLLQIGSDPGVHSNELSLGDIFNELFARRWIGKKVEPDAVLLSGNDPLCFHELSQGSGDCLDGPFASSSYFALSACSTKGGDDPEDLPLGGTSLADSRETPGSTVNGSWDRRPGGYRSRSAVAFVKRLGKSSQSQRIALSRTSKFPKCSLP